MTFGYGPMPATVSASDKLRREFIALAAALLRHDAPADIAVTRALDLAGELERRNVAPWQVTS